MKVKVTKQYITSLKEKIARLEKELNEVRNDRQIFRDEFLFLLKSNISMCSENKYLTPSFMIERLSKLMNRTKDWYW